MDAGGSGQALLGSDVVLATGGIGALFPSTTNPPGADGAGLALALAAGAAPRDMEFVQFHPTALDVGTGSLPLITEALRGAGARLRDGAGRLLMADAHPLGDLAPRDIVARRVWQARYDTGAVTLDARALAIDCPRAFPTVLSACLQHGIDPAGCRFRSPQPHISTWADCARTTSAAPASTGYMPWARLPAAASTVATGWPAIRCWSAWCLGDAWGRTSPSILLLRRMRAMNTWLHLKWSRADQAWINRHCNCSATPWVMPRARCARRKVCARPAQRLRRWHDMAGRRVWRRTYWRAPVDASKASVRTGAQMMRSRHRPPQLLRRDSGFLISGLMPCRITDGNVR